MVYRIEKTTRTVIYLKKAILIRSGSTKNYPIRNIKCTGKEEKINSLREGMHVRLEGMLVLPELPRNPGQFNRRIYESGKKIDFYLENPTVLEVKEQRSGVREVVEIWKTEMMNRCEKIYPDAEAGILEAMLFGEKRELSGDIKELYQAAGISHVLVISGLHISLLALAVAGILRRLGFPMPVWVILSVGVLAGYGILIGQPTTAVRALLMFFVLQGARLLGRSYDLLSALAFAGILMLLDNPDLILDGGCRLSFCAVIGVGWYVSEKNKIFRSIGEKEKRKNIKIMFEIIEYLKSHEIYWEMDHMEGIPRITMVFKNCDNCPNFITEGCIWFYEDSMEVRVYYSELGADICKTSQNRSELYRLLNFLNARLWPRVSDGMGGTLYQSQHLLSPRFYVTEDDRYDITAAMMVSYTHFEMYALEIEDFITAALPGLMNVLSPFVFLVLVKNMTLDTAIDRVKSEILGEEKR